MASWSAVRTRVAVPRASSRFARFAHAIRSRAADAAISSSSPRSYSSFIALMPPPPGATRTICLSMFVRSWWALALPGVTRY